MEIIYLGLEPYQDVLALMDKIHKEIVEDPGQQGKILVTQHPPTVTMGKRELWEDLLYSQQQLIEQNIAFQKIDRGGSVTVHEPGQIVIYPIFNLAASQHTVRSYVNLLEEAMIETAAHYGVIATRDPINPGVWVGKNKIGALGIRVLNKVTKHGIAFNVNNSLQTFAAIIPCGIQGRGVTSLCAEVNNSCLPIYAEVEKLLSEKISQKVASVG